MLCLIALYSVGTALVAVATALISRIEGESGLSAIWAMLSFFHSLSVVLWYDTPGLREV